jgi:hypothetical protein
MRNVPALAVSRVKKGHQRPYSGMWPLLRHAKMLFVAEAAWDAMLKIGRASRVKLSIRECEVFLNFGRGIRDARIQVNSPPFGIRIHIFVLGLRANLDSTCRDFLSH